MLFSLDPKFMLLNFRWDTQTCSDEGSDDASRGKHLTACNDFADHKESVKIDCDEKSSCSWHGTNQIAGDPCFGTNKYTVVKYKCV